MPIILFSNLEVRLLKHLAERELERVRGYYPANELELIIRKLEGG